MKVITATEAQNRFGNRLIDAKSEPISITHNGKEKGVLISSTDYQKMKHQALQSVNSKGFESGEPTPFNMKDIKRKAREKTGLNFED